jgi:hypothetical protein
VKLIKILRNSFFLTKEPSLIIEILIKRGGSKELIPDFYNIKRIYLSEKEEKQLSNDVEFEMFFSTKGGDCSY